MDQATADLIVQLCTRAGMIMEDASAVAVTLDTNDTEFKAQLEQLVRASSRIGVLLAAAAVLGSE